MTASRPCLCDTMCGAMGTAMGCTHPPTPFRGIADAGPVPVMGDARPHAHAGMDADAWMHSRWSDSRWSVAICAALECVDVYCHVCVCLAHGLRRGRLTAHLPTFLCDAMNPVRWQLSLHGARPGLYDVHDCLPAGRVVGSLCNARPPINEAARLHDSPARRRMHTCGGR